MNGFQLTFFTEQSTRYQHLPLGEWLVDFAKRQGVLGATLVSGTEGLDHLGHLHTAHFLSGSDHPVMVTISTDEPGCDRLLEALARESISLGYLKLPIEYGRVGQTEN
jgi:PII-like signaling protein